MEKYYSETSVEFKLDTLCYIREDKILLKVLSRQQNIAKPLKEISRRGRKQVPP
jgi:hypothetical protein